MITKEKKPCFFAPLFLYFDCDVSVWAENSWAGSQSINQSNHIRSINQPFFQSINLQSYRIKSHWRWLFIRVIMHLSNWCQYFAKSSPPLLRLDIPFFRCFCLIIYQTMLKNFSKICKIIFQVTLSQFSVTKSKRKYKIIWICVSVPPEFL